MKFQIVLIAALCAFAYASPIPAGEEEIKPAEEAVKTINKVDENVEEPKVAKPVETRADVKIEETPEKPAEVSDEIVLTGSSYGAPAAIEERKLDSEVVAAVSDSKQSVEEVVSDEKTADVPETPEEKVQTVEAVAAEEPAVKAVEAVKADDAKVEGGNLDAVKEEIKTVEHIDDSVRQVRETEVKAEEPVKVAEEPAKEITEIKIAPDAAPALNDEVYAAVFGESSASVAIPEVAAVPVVLEEKAAEPEKKSIEVTEEKKADKEESKVAAEPKKEVKEEKKEEPAKDESDESIESHEHHDSPNSEESGESNDSKI